MTKVGVTDLKNRLSQYLRLVKRGGVVEVLEHSIPIARIVAVEGQDMNQDDLLKRLVRDGIVTPARRKPVRIKKPPVPCAVDVVKILIEERGDR